MTTFGLSFPTARFTLTLPAELAETLLLLYPRVRREPARGERDPTARLEITERGSRWELAVDGAAAGLFPDAVRALLGVEHHLVERSVRACGEWLAFHAGAVDLGGTACLLAGPAESGKTSSTFQLVELGGTFVADEVAIVDPVANRVHPYLRTPLLDSSFVREVAVRYGVRCGTVRELVPPISRYLPARLAREPVEVSTLVLPRFRRGAATEVVALDPGEALTEVLGACFEPRQDVERAYERVIELLERWSIRRLIYGDTAGAREVLAELAAPVAGSA